MVKNSFDKTKQTTKPPIAQDSLSSPNISMDLQVQPEESTSSDFVSLDQAEQPRKTKTKTKTKTKSSIKFEDTAVGCLIQYLRGKSPRSLEDIARHVKTVESRLVSTTGKKYKKDAFGIADYAISWNPKLFLLDRHFNYYLNEKRAAEFEENFKNRDARKAQQGRESKQRNQQRLERQIESRESWERIRKIILDDLKGDMEEPSHLTKAFLILTSGNQEVAGKLKASIKQVYIDIVRRNQASS